LQQLMSMNGIPNNSPRKRILLRISSVLMLLAALPMLLWCLGLIDNAALDYTYAGAGCFAAGIAYIFSMVTAIAGLAFAERLHRHRWCRTLGYIQLAAGVLLVYSLRSYATITLPPLFLSTVLYFVGVGWREKRDCEQQ
jgi:predicted membrane channel-forming protein YqfA (hemolysin III family)